MDKRICLKPGDHLDFTGMTCEIEKTIGKGSNAIVYLGRYEDSLNKGLFHHVLIKELFPYHPENQIYRKEDNSICISESGKDLYELQKLSFERGNEIHLRMLEKHPDKISSNINTFFKNGTFYSVIGFDAGKSLDKTHVYDNKTIRQVVTLMRDIIDAVEIFHSSGYLHLDISPDNILIIGDDKSSRVSLIDYNSVHRIDELKLGNALYCSIKDGYTAPEVRSGNMSAISEASDIYSVTAVFYWLITGKPLTLFQSLCKRPPNVRECALLKGLPETVLTQIELILRRGLSSLPERRYPDCERIKNDFNELLLRIDGIGITHAALWESAKRTVTKMIKSNPSFQHLDKNKLYPIRAITNNSESLIMDKAIDLQLQKGSAVIYGPAGIGKTTALLHTVFNRNHQYSPLQPAFIYVSLFDYNSSGENFIKNRILEDLKFDTDVRSMEDARDRLIKTFNESITIKEKERPRFVLLLDGFNEADGETDPLVKEILSLSELKGVTIFITTRSTKDLLQFDSLELAPLTEPDIIDVLSGYSLAYPDSENIRELLKTPLMLSVFCKAALNNQKQIQCDSTDDLLQEYISGLCEKENLMLPEESLHNWLVDAAVNFVLPCICATIAEKNKAVTDADLLKTVKKCFRLLTSSRLNRIFPQYIGHSKDIRNNAETADQWYGMVVIDILWRKMGLLIKEPGRGYKLMHQLVQEHLLKSYKYINKCIKKQNIIIYSVSASALIAVITLLILLIKPDPYDTELSKTYLDSLVVSQVQTGEEILCMKDLVETSASENDNYYITLMSLNQSLELHKSVISGGITGSAAMTEKIYKELEATGKVMPWSGKEVNETHADYLFSLGEEISENYGLYAEILDYLNNNPDLDKQYGKSFRKLLSNKVAADAALSDALFYSTCIVHLSEMEKSDPESYQYYWLTISRNADLSDSEPEEPDSAAIEKLRKDSKAASDELNSSEIITIYRRMQE